MEKAYKATQQLGGGVEPDRHGLPDFRGGVLDRQALRLKGIGLDKLEEAILLQSEVLDLKANPNRPGDGAVIEAKLDKGRGPVATVLVQRGTLKQGDIVVAGAEWGRVRALVNDTGDTVHEAGPSVPVEVLGFNGGSHLGPHSAAPLTQAGAAAIFDDMRQLLEIIDEFTAS